MATPQTQRSVPELLQNIVNNLQEIIRSEFRLAKTEFKDEAGKAAKPAATFGTGLVLSFYGIGFLLLAAVYGLSTIMAGWMAALLVGAVLTGYCHRNSGFKWKETETNQSISRQNNSKLGGKCPMGETTGQIERHIQETRDDLGENLNELQQKVKTAMDWRAQFEQRPGTSLALAFGGGVLLSALLPTRHSSRTSRRVPRMRYRIAMPPFRASHLTDPFNRNSNEPLQTLDALKGALLGIAATKVTAFIEDLLPGFKQEFTKAKAGGGKLNAVDSVQSSWEKSSAVGAD